MKSVLVVIISIFLFLGCAQTQRNIGYSSQVASKKSIEKKIDIIIEKKEESFSEDDKISNDFKKSDSVAIVFSSSQIGKYALEVTASINTYLLYKNNNFMVETYDIDKQDENNLVKIFEEIDKNGIKKVILMITSNRLSQLKEIKSIAGLQIYLPLINSYDSELTFNTTNLELIYGGISYKKQFEKLLQYNNERPLVNFYDNSKIGSVLHSYLNNQEINYSKKIDDKNGLYKYFLKNRKVKNSVIILNTPIVKSSIILSQIYALEVNTKQILSTQLNYSPFLFSLTQRPDRRNIIIANSIGKLPNDLIEYNSLINNNIVYSWVNYSVILGVEYFLSGNLNKFEGVSIKNNQVDYSVELYRANGDSFVKIN
ncbi:MAG: hypothetical protein U9R16_05120 [Campylobacterota bacterium]|nr:hypothetical protein [Campylobacterota bacterium]